MTKLTKLLRRLRHVVRFQHVDRDLQEEMEFHLVMRRQELERAGLDAAKADVEARRAMGSRLLARDQARDVWGWPWMAGFLLDFKLGLRMLVRYPLLTIVAGASMAFGIAAGVGGFQLRTQLLDPTLPLDDSRRIVGLRHWDIRHNRPGPLNDTDFTAWREQLHRVEELGAAALIERNLTVDGAVEPISVAAMTTTGFRVARVAPLLGRTFVDADESPSAPPVAVIGHSLWQRRFSADPHIVGRTIRLGTEQPTIVGVMPEKFGFPVAHQIWIPLRPQTLSRVNVSDAATLLVFGRLADGITLDEAQAELLTVGRRMAADGDGAEIQQFLRAEVVPYAHLILDPRSYAMGLTLANVFLIMLLVVVAANVALLMFARAAARENEIRVRNALGASRGRIVAQLFLEAAVLSGLSVIVGLVAARDVIGSLLHTLEADSGSPLPFWMDDRLTPSTVAYGVGLMMFGALISGVGPALKTTGRGLQAGLRHFTPGGGGYRFGGVWTAAIVAQVALTVTFPAAAFFFHRWVVEGQTRDVGLPAGEYLSARLVMDRTPAATIEELRSQLFAEPNVTAVTFADRLPGMRHAEARFEVEGDDAGPTNGHEVRLASIDAHFFDALGAPVLSGRGFTPSDFVSGREVAIVNTSFVDRILHGRNPVGRRIRLAALGDERAPGAWMEIVGVARDLGMVGTEGIGLYRPLTPGSSAVHVAVRVRGAPESLAGRLRAHASEVEPTLRLYDVMPLDQVGADQWLESQYLSRLLGVLSVLALLLSLMAIYSVIAFTVVQRRRDIGVRLALGADQWRTIAATVRAPLVQIVLGISAGIGLVVLVFVGLFETTPTPLEAALIAAYAALMLAVCLSASIVPTRRALRLEPSEILRADG